MVYERLPQRDLAIRAHFCTQTVEEQRCKIKIRSIFYYSSEKQTAFVCFFTAKQEMYCPILIFLFAALVVLLYLFFVYYILSPIASLSVVY